MAGEFELEELLVVAEVLAVASECGTDGLEATRAALSAAEGKGGSGGASDGEPQMEGNALTRRAISSVRLLKSRLGMASAYG